MEAAFHGSNDTAIQGIHIYNHVGCLVAWIPMWHSSASILAFTFKSFPTDCIYFLKQMSTKLLKQFLLL